MLSAGFGIASSHATVDATFFPISSKTGAKFVAQIGNHLPPLFFASSRSAESLASDCALWIFSCARAV